MKKALVIGINYYEHGSSLFGCVNDAKQLGALLERDGDGSVNFDVQLLTGSNQLNPVTKIQVKSYLQIGLRHISQLCYTRRLLPPLTPLPPRNPPAACASLKKRGAFSTRIEFAKVTVF